jgi:hypothetical protein
VALPARLHVTEGSDEHNLRRSLGIVDTYSPIGEVSIHDDEGRGLGGMRARRGLDGVRTWVGESGMGAGGFAVGQDSTVEAGFHGGGGSFAVEAGFLG